MKYDAIFEEAEEGGFKVFVPSLAGCISEGDTFEEAKQNITEAVSTYLESMTMDEIPVKRNANTIFHRFTLRTSDFLVWQDSFVLLKSFSHFFFPALSERFQQYFLLALQTFCFG